MYVRREGGISFSGLAGGIPSLSHDYLFEVLERQGIPAQFISGIRSFYTNNFHSIRLDGEESPSVVVNSGVRQGCPMSPVLFALALDPFLDYLSRQLPPGDLVRAYADDMALVLRSHSTLAHVIPCYERLAAASCRNVNTSKTVNIP